MMDVEYIIMLGILLGVLVGIISGAGVYTVHEIMETPQDKCLDECTYLDGEIKLECIKFCSEKVESIKQNDNNR